MEGLAYNVNNQPIQKANLRILSHYIGVDEGGNQHVDDRLTLAVEVGDLWAAIFKFTDQELLTLINQLVALYKARKQGAKKQISAYWVSECKPTS